jgi:hypothetical protein
MLDVIRTDVTARYGKAVGYGKRWCDAGEFGVGDQNHAMVLYKYVPWSDGSPNLFAPRLDSNT